MDWDVGLRQVNNRVTPVGLYDLDRNIRPVGRAYKQLICDWRMVLPAQSVCLVVPIIMPAEYDEPNAQRQRARARHLRVVEPDDDLAGRGTGLNRRWTHWPGSGLWALIQQGPPGQGDRNPMLIDSHCHLDFPAFQERLPEVLERPKAPVSAAWSRSRPTLSASTPTGPWPNATRAYSSRSAPIRTTPRPNPMSRHRA